MPRLSKIGAAALAAFGWTSGAAAVSASYLQVAGGGGGGFDIGGGGGAGGLLTGTTTLNLTLSYTVTVGAGGAGSTSGSATGVLGSNSQFGTLTASVGGGGGGSRSSAKNGANGGSGGGGSADVSSGGTGTSGQGNAGGGQSSGDQAGGGGGASAAGAGGGGVGTGTGNGGDGTASSITGTSVTYAGGGGGGSSPAQAPAGTGGAGGGGAGSSSSSGATAGTANLGGGGGGGSNQAAPGSNGGNGGSGVVIISYPSPQKFGGGIVTVSGANTIHTFTTSGTLSPLSTLTASYLVVGGGGGGSSGGGGAGGYLSGTQTLDTNSIYTITVGGGGAGTGAGSVRGSTGTNSSFVIASATALGGGGGGANTGQQDGTSGGSGGGGGYISPSTNGVGGAGTSGQGNAGGTSSLPTTFGSGGGGASETGNTDGSGQGGDGTASSITGSSVTYAGGGGGIGDLSTSPVLGGTGGGGNGNIDGSFNGANGTANTGGGGGGRGGAGGSGVVIISYAGSTQLMAGGTVTISGGNVIHTFTSSGYLTPLTLVGNSLRFRASASAYLNRTPSVEGNRQKWTFSAWVKRANIGTTSEILGSYGTTDNTNFAVEFSGDTLYVGLYTIVILQTTAVYRDPAAWYHIVVSFDSTQATAANRVSLFVNGVQVTAFSTDNRSSITQNGNYGINSTNVHNLGRNPVLAARYLDGYMTEVQLIDGQALTPNSFGTFNQYGVWQPIRYGGSYGTNGFYLPFTAGTSTFAGSFNGSNQWLSLAQNAAFNFGTGDFTIEACVYGNSWNSVNPIIALGDGAVGGGSPVYSGWAMRYDLTNGLGIYRFDGSETSLFSGATVPTNTWNHMAISRSSGTLRMFINGVQVYSAANTTTYNNVNSNTLKIGGNWVIGGGVVTWVNGFISNVRIVNNAGLYTSNFTPPTANLTAVSGTALLTLQNSSIVDNSTNAFSITNNNTVTTGQTYPFSAAKIFNDQGPAGNNWTPNNISGQFGSTLDYMTDVPTLTSTTAANYATFNPIIPSTTNLINGNLTRNSSVRTNVSTFPAIGGKYYFETTIQDANGNGGVGVKQTTAYPLQDYDTSKCATYFANGEYKIEGASQTSGFSSYTNGDVIGCAVDSTVSPAKIWWSKNGTWQGTGNPTTAGYSLTAGLDYYFMVLHGSGSSSTTASVNFGQQPFAYTIPSGYTALNTFNL
jgi:hypothetical protein